MNIEDIKAVADEYDERERLKLKALYRRVGRRVPDDNDPGDWFTEKQRIEENKDKT